MNQMAPRCFFPVPPPPSSSSSWHIIPTIHSWLCEEEGEEEAFRERSEAPQGRDEEEEEEEEEEGEGGHLNIQVMGTLDGQTTGAEATGGPKRDPNLDQNPTLAGPKRRTKVAGTKTGPKCGPKLVSFVF